MKSIRLKYFGQLGYQFLLGIFIIVIIGGFVLRFGTLSDNDRFALYFASPFLFISILFLTRNLLYQIREIQIIEGSIIFKNKVTKKMIKYPLKDVQGFRFNSVNHNVYLIDNTGQELTSIYDPFYTDLDKFLVVNEIQYLGRSKKWFSA